MIPSLDDHLTHLASFQNDLALGAAVAALLELGTCFAVIGGERAIRTTERGAARLAELGLG